MWCFLFLPYRSLMCCSGHLFPTRYFLQLLPLPETWWYYSCIGSAGAKENSAANYLSPAGCQLLRHTSVLPHLHSKNHCNGVSPPLRAWGITWLKVFRHFWRWAVVHWNLTDFHPGTVTEKGGYMTQTHSKLDWWGGWLPLLPMVVEHNHNPGIFPCDVASWLSGLSPKSSLLRRAGHLLGNYSIHCPSVLPHDEQGCSLPHQNTGLAFRTSIWAQYNKASFSPSTIPGPYWNAICVGGQYLKQRFPSE